MQYNDQCLTDSEMAPAPYLEFHVNDEVCDDMFSEEDTIDNNHVNCYEMHYDMLSIHYSSSENEITNDSSHDVVNGEEK